MPNEPMIEGWNGETGERWAKDADHYDRLLADAGQRLAAAASPAKDDRVLDIGCGTGALARALAPRASRVVGVDISGPMLEEGRRRAAAAGLDNVEFVQADAQVHEFEPGSFDLAVSRFGVMFFDDSVAAFRNIGNALRPGARLVFASWQDLTKNEWLMVPAAAALAFVPVPELAATGSDGQPAPGPFAFADADRVRAILEDADFVDIAFDGFTVPLVMGTTVDEAVGFLRGTDLAARLFADVDEATVEKAWAAVADVLAERVRDEGVVLDGTVWLVTARRF